MDKFDLHNISESDQLSIYLSIKSSLGSEVQTTVMYVNNANMAIIDESTMDQIITCIIV